MAKKKLLKPAKVMAKWNAIPEKERNSYIARSLAKLAGMKSIGEVRCAADMDSRNILYKYEAEVLEYQHLPQKYTPDFTIYESDDLLIEYKGKMTNETRKKLIAIARCNPTRRICLVFEKPSNKISSRPKAMRYWQWAEKQGFEWSTHYIKEEWVQ
jgi:hypothetical protein